MIPVDNELETSKAAGSPIPGEPEFLLIGKLRRPHGVRGEMVMDVYTDFPERLKPGVSIFAGENHRELKIRSVRENGTSLLIGFESVDSPETAGQFRNQSLYVRASDRPTLPDGEYYHHQLIAMQVIDEDGRALGRLTEILDLPANDVYIIKSDNGKELLLPAIESVIQRIDLEKREILVRLLPGLVQDSP